MNMVKYFIKGTVVGSRNYDNYGEEIPDYCLPEYLEEIEKLFTKDPEDELAQYIWENGERDSQIYGIVTEIWVGVRVIEGSMYSWTEVTANRELTESEKEALLDYLTGQFSDGYGEGLEQHEFTTYTEWETVDEWDDEEEEFYPNDYEVKVYCYLHLWQTENFKLEIVKMEKTEERISWLEQAVEDGDITSAELEDAKNIDFNINGEDYGLFLGQVKAFLCVSDIKTVSYFDINVDDYSGAYEVLLKNNQRRIFAWKDFKQGLDEIIEIIKPKCKLIGENGNIFNLMGLASKALRRAGMPKVATEMTKKIYQNAKDYDHALRIIMDYVEVE